MGLDERRSDEDDLFGNELLNGRGQVGEGSRCDLLVESGSAIGFKAQRADFLDRVHLHHGGMSKLSSFDLGTLLILHRPRSPELGLLDRLSPDTTHTSKSVTVAESSSERFVSSTTAFKRLKPSSFAFFPLILRIQLLDS